LALFGRLRAARLHDQAQALGPEDDDAALELYRRALDLEPERPNTLYNIGLIHKYRREWPLSLAYNRRALDLRPDDEATRWNLAIAATALGDWSAAREMWGLCGHDVGEGEGPIDRDFGSACVRLNPDDKPEVVWATRVDPVRARVRNVPFLESGVFYGDVMLHDGAPTGVKVSAEREYSIFNAFERTERSPYGTAVVALTGPSETDLDRLAAAGEAEQMLVEDWTAVGFLCKACSEGVSEAHHEHDPVWNPEREIGVAVWDEATLQRILMDWSASGPERSAAITEVVW
jgi:hypothetical protein